MARENARVFSCQTDPDWRRMKLLRLSWSGGCWLTATCALTVFEYINRAEPNFGESSRTVLFAMLALSLPTSLLTAAVCALIEWARWGSIWVEFVFVILVGYIQWVSPSRTS